MRIGRPSRPTLHPPCRPRPYGILGWDLGDAYWGTVLVLLILPLLYQ
jgi:hypothetical protein